MKKKNLKSLKLNKRSISTFENQVIGGKGFPTLELNSICNICETDVTCPTWATCDFTKAEATCSICDV